jgi:hypothetical protein
MGQKSHVINTNCKEREYMHSEMVGNMKTAYRVKEKELPSFEME